MLISELIEQLRADLESLGELGGAETLATAQRLGSALGPAIQKRFLDSLNEVVQEFNLHDSAPLSLRLEGDEVCISRLEPAGVEEPASVPSPSDYSARIALRLSDDLKEHIEALATDVGSSVNSWIVRTLERSVRGDSMGSSLKGRNQLRGKGRA